MKAWLRIPLQFLSLAFLLSIATAAVITGAYYYAEPSLPGAEELRDVRIQIPLRVYSRDGRLMQQYGEQLRTPARLEQIPEMLRNAVIAAEDDQFYQHFGIDILSTIRAVMNYTISTVIPSDGRVAGGSTITQQIARTTNLLDRDYALGRKIKEIFLAFRIEEEFTKDEILQLYLNTYFFGQRSYGVVSAARSYFDKDVSDLTLSEAAIIAGIPTAPSRNNPYTSPENAANRRAYVLRRMFELDFIDGAEREAALAEPILSQLFDPETELSAGYVADMAYLWCQRKFGKTACDTTGLKITTTLDSRHQRAANAALPSTLEDYDRNHGYRGPIDRVDFEMLPESGAELTAALDELLADYPSQFGAEAAVVVSVNDVFADVYMRHRGNLSLGLDAVTWARSFISDDRQGPTPTSVSDVLAAGDVVRFRRHEDGRLELFQVPDVQGALVSVDPLDGAVTSMVGGYSFALSAFNRGLAERQPGSSFKPFFYLSALAHGYTLASVVNDAPLRYYSEALEEYRSVENYDGKYHGEVTLRFALTNSLNTVADRVIRDILPRNSARFVERFGFNPSQEERNASLALGSAVVSPLELASAYAILANGGYAVGIRPDPSRAPQAYYIQRVEDADGNVLYDASLSVEWVCPEPEPDVEVLHAEPELVAGKSELFPLLRCATRVESPQRIYLITDVLKDVVRLGSGARAGRAFPRRTDLAGKTGTTTGPRDAWFAGFNADVVAVARVGFDDDSRSLGDGEQGGRTAIPAWIDFMQVALDGQPNHSLPRPPGIVDRRVNALTGLIAADCNTNTVWEMFLPEHQPAQESSNGCVSTSPGPIFDDGPSGNERIFQ